MTWKDFEKTEQTIEVLKADRLRAMKEDKAFKRDEKDPEFTTGDIARITGLTVREVNKALQSANVGTFALRPKEGFGMIKTRVVRWSQLQGLAKDLGWFG